MTDRLAHFLRAFADTIEHVTLAPSLSGEHARFQASAKLRGSGGYRIAYHDDPAQALAQALMVKRTGQPFEPGVRYFHHPESSCILKQWEDDPYPNGGDGLVEEVDARQYYELCLDYGVIDTPLESRKNMVEAVVEMEDGSDLL